MEMSTLDLLDPQQSALSGHQAFVDQFLGERRTIFFTSSKLDCVSDNKLKTDWGSLALGGGGGDDMPGGTWKPEVCHVPIKHDWPNESQRKNGPSL